MNYNVIMGITFAILAAYVVLLIIYLNAERKNDGQNGFVRATALKLTLSGLFCATGLLSFIWFNPSALQAQLFILLGLFAAFAGDYFLQYIRLNVRKYIAGIVCFAVTQGLFITALFIDNSLDLTGWIITIAITAAVLLSVLILMKKQDWKLGREQNVLSFYTVLIVFMAARAVASLTSGLSVSSVFFAAGAVLFLLSDLLLGIWNYETDKRIHANLNWITYYAGMILIAFSIMPAFLVPILHFEF